MPDVSSSCICTLCLAWLLDISVSWTTWSKLVWWPRIRKNNFLRPLIFQMSILKKLNLWRATCDLRFVLLFWRCRSAVEIFNFAVFLNFLKNLTFSFGCMFLNIESRWILIEGKCHQNFSFLTFFFPIFFSKVTCKTKFFNSFWACVYELLILSIHKKTTFFHFFRLSTTTEGPDWTFLKLTWHKHCVQTERLSGFF